MTIEPAITAVFVEHAADILADTTRGLSGLEIDEALRTYRIEFDVTVPHPSYPFQAPSKRKVLSQNLMAFSDPQKYRIILGLCDHRSMWKNRDAAEALKLRLIDKYGHLSGEALGVEVNKDLLNQARHWLKDFPDALNKFNQALQKYEAKIFKRNVLDDLRLSLEFLLRAVLSNNKPLEKQKTLLGEFVIQRGGSPELSDMCVTLVGFYTTYQNRYVKHDDAIIEEEVEFVIEITAAVLKHLVRLAAR